MFLAIVDPGQVLKSVINRKCVARSNVETFYQEIPNGHLAPEANIFLCSARHEIKDLKTILKILLTNLTGVEEAGVTQDVLSLQISTPEKSGSDRST